MHCLHVLARRRSDLFWDLAHIIEDRFDKQCVSGMLNVRTGDGRGVVDLALSTHVGFAKGIHKCYREAVPQREAPASGHGGRKQQWTRQAWQTGDSDRKRGSPPFKRNRGKWPVDDESWWWSSHSWW